MNDKNYINVGMNKFEVAIDNNDIIGCDALASCIAILLYSEKYKIAGVLHKSIDGNIQDGYVMEEIYNLIVELGKILELSVVNMKGDPEDAKFEYMLIEPVYFSDKTKEYLDLYKYLLEKNKYTSFSDEKLRDADIVTLLTQNDGQEYYSNAFAFDVSNGKFVKMILLFVLLI